MTLAITIARRHSLVLFFSLTVLLTWGLIPLMKLSPILAIAGLMTPAAAAWIVMWLGEGRFGSIRLGRRLSIWKVDWPWYIAAAALPATLSLIAALIGSALSARGPTSGPPELQPITPIVLIVLIIAIAEEIGWRGYALPKLLESFPPLAAAVILGLMWGVWRIPLFSLPGMPPLDTPLGAYLVYSVAFSAIYTWLYQGTRGSVPLAALMHASGDIIIFSAPGLNPDQAIYLMAAVYLGAALVITFINGPDLKRGE